jgi:peptidoglycan hydrolase CwlO-like protein
MRSDWLTKLLLALIAIALWLNFASSMRIFRSIDSMESDISSIQSAVSSIQSDVSSIESK